jgi:hypothetical protein
MVGDGIEKPGNIGAILRTADALGASFLGSGLGTDLVNPNVIRSAQGSLFATPTSDVDRESAISCCLEGFVPVTHDHGFGGRNTVSLAELLGEHLARRELRRQPVRAEQAEPSAGELVSDAERERQFGTDHREVDAQIRGCLRDAWKVIRSHREEIRGLSDSGVARSRIELCDARRPPQCVHDGVLSTAGAEHQHPHRA